MSPFSTKTRCRTRHTLTSPRGSSDASLHCAKTERSSTLGESGLRVASCVNPSNPVVFMRFADVGSRSASEPRRSFVFLRSAGLEIRFGNQLSIVRQGCDRCQRSRRLRQVNRLGSPVSAAMARYLKPPPANTVLRRLSSTHAVWLASESARKRPITNALRITSRKLNDVATVPLVYKDH